jgi:hypothetical protein
VWPLASPLLLLSVQGLLRLQPPLPREPLLSHQGLVEAASTARMRMLAERLLLRWLHLSRSGLRLAHRSQQRC